jgi:hypothetical protein
LAVGAKHLRLDLLVKLGFLSANASPLLVYARSLLKIPVDGEDAAIINTVLREITNSTMDG